MNEQTGDLKSASDLYAELAKLQPDKPKHLVAQASVDYRRGEIESVRAILSSLINAVIDNVHDLFATAELLAFLNEKDDAIRFAYRALQIGFKKPESHLRFIQVFHQCSSVDPDAFEVKEVTEDTAILVQETQQWIIILGQGPADLGKNEFSKDDLTAQALLGHQIGDTVSIKQGPIENLSYTIKEIQSIYLRAYQDSFENFGTRFPEDNSIAKMHFDGNPTKLLTVVAGQSVHLDQIYEIYNKGYLTFSQFAALAGKNEIDLWGGLINGAKYRLLASLGTAEEQKQHLKRAQEFPQIALDLSALLTSWYLDTLIHLPKRFENIYIPQTVVDTINIRIINMRMIGREGLKFISFENGHFESHDVPADQVEKGIEKLEELCDFVTAHCKIIPLEPGAFPILDDEEKHYLLDRNSLAPVLVAKQTGSYLYSDDMRLRIVAENRMGVLGFWTQPLLANLVESKLITQDYCFDKTIRLIQAHYYYTAVNPDLIIYELQKHPLDLTPETIDALNVLRGPNTDEDDAVRTVAVCLEQVWLQGWMIEQKLFVLDQCLTAVTANRQGLIVLYKIVHLLRQSVKLQIAAQLLNELIQQIKNWSTVRVHERKI